MKSIFFWDMTPCSALSGTRRFGGTYRLHLQGCTTQRTTRRHIPEEDTLQNHRCENLKSYSCKLSTELAEENVKQEKRFTESITIQNYKDSIITQM
jgi:hypothetical protein